MQITNSVVCGRSKGCIYKQIKPPLVSEHAFPLTGFVCKMAQVTDISAYQISYMIYKISAISGIFILYKKSYILN